ncbi:hypothetical protein [Stomatohabitans albus]|uniref:hypothetical protein n=1 Tax=Stomatohabitans albus TaxID=3110766 RepID=UPI00300D45A4
MAIQVYKTLSKIVGIILALVGVGALYGAMFANSFITAQFEDQNIHFPSEEAINAQVEQGRITEEDAQVIRPYADQILLNGDQAKAFADHYIFAHMRNSAKKAGLEGEEATYEGAGDPAREAKTALTDRIKADNPSDDEATIAAKTTIEMANPLSTYPEAKRAAELDSLRNEVLFRGNAIRGMLLNAYGWGLLGKIANVAGIALIIIGIALAGWGFIPSKKNTEAAA